MISNLEKGLKIEANIDVLNAPREGYYIGKDELKFDGKDGSELKHWILLLEENRIALVNDADIVRVIEDQRAMSVVEIDRRVRAVPDIAAKGETMDLVAKRTNLIFKEEFEKASKIAERIAGTDKQPINADLPALIAALEQKQELSSFYTSDEDYKSDRDLLLELQEVDHASESLDSTVAKDEEWSVDEMVDDDIQPDHFDDPEEIAAVQDSALIAGDNQYNDIDSIGGRLSEVKRGFNEPHGQEYKVSGFGAIGHGVGNLMGALAGRISNFNIGTATETTQIRVLEEILSDIKSAEEPVVSVIEQLESDKELVSLVDMMHLSEDGIAGADKRLEAGRLVQEHLELNHPHALEAGLSGLDSSKTLLAKADNYRNKKFENRQDMAAEIADYSQSSESYATKLRRIFDYDELAKARFGDGINFFAKLKETLRALMASLSKDTDNRMKANHAPSPQNN